LALRRLDSTDLEGTGRVVVTAFVTASQRLDTEVEKIVGRLSLEPTVSAARWQADVRIETETHAALDRPNLGPDLPAGTGK
jgi:putative Mg2+ transporter-C (MgtC) family protein